MGKLGANLLPHLDRAINKILAKKLALWQIILETFANGLMTVLKGKQKSMQTTLEIYAKDSQFLVQDAKFDVEKIAKLDGNGNITVNYIKKENSLFSSIANNFLMTSHANFSFPMHLASSKVCFFAQKIANSELFLN